MIISWCEDGFAFGVQPLAVASGDNAGIGEDLAMNDPDLMVMEIDIGGNYLGAQAPVQIQAPTPVPIGTPAASSSTALSPSAALSPALCRVHTSGQSLDHSGNPSLKVPNHRTFEDKKELIKQLHATLKEKSTEILGLVGCTTSPEEILYFEQKVSNTSFKGWFGDGSIHLLSFLGPEIACGITLLSLESHFGDKKSTVAMLASADPRLQVVWNILSGREKIPPYSVLLTVAFSQEPILDIIKKLVPGVFNVGTYRAAPSGGDVIWTVILSALLKSLYKIDERDVHEDGTLLSISKAKIALGYEFKISSVGKRRGVSWDLKKNLNLIAKNGQVLILAVEKTKESTKEENDPKRVYYVLNANKFYNSGGTRDFTTIYESNLPKFLFDPSIVHEEGMQQWAFKFETEKAVAENLASFFLAGTTAYDILYKIGTENHLGWKGEDFLLLLAQQDLVSGFFKKALGEDVLHNICISSSHEELQARATDALKILDQTGISGLKLASPFDLNMPLNAAYQSQFNAICRFCNKCTDCGIEWEIPFDDTCVPSVHIRRRGTEQWLTVLVRSSVVDMRDKKTGKERGQTSYWFYVNIERMPAGSNAKAQFPYPPNSYTFAIFYGLKLWNGKEIGCDVFAASQEWIENVLLRNHNGCGVYTLTVKRDRDKYPARTNTALDLMGVDLDDPAAIEKLIALEAPSAVIPGFKSSAEVERVLMKKRDAWLANKLETEEKDDRQQKTIKNAEASTSARVITAQTIYKPEEIAAIRRTSNFIANEMKDEATRVVTFVESELAAATADVKAARREMTVAGRVTLALAEVEVARNRRDEAVQFATKIRERRSSFNEKVATIVRGVGEEGGGGAGGRGS